MAVVLSREWEFNGRWGYFVKADVSDAEEFRSEIVFLAATLMKAYRGTVTCSMSHCFVLPCDRCVKLILLRERKENVPGPFSVRDLAVHFLLSL